MDAHTNTSEIAIGYLPHEMDLEMCKRLNIDTHTNTREITIGYLPHEMDLEMCKRLNIVVGVLVRSIKK